MFYNENKQLPPNTLCANNNAQRCAEYVDEMMLAAGTHACK